MATPDKDLNSMLALRLDRFDISTRLSNCMHVEGVSTIGDLVTRTEKDILGWQNAGRKTLDEIRHLLGRVGLKLSGDQIPVGSIDRKLLSELAIKAVNPTQRPTERSSAVEPEGSDNSNQIYLNAVPEELQAVLVMPIKHVYFSARAQKVIESVGALFLGELAQLTTAGITKNHNAGRGTAHEIECALAKCGLNLGNSIPDWSRPRATTLQRELLTKITEQERLLDKQLLDSIAPEPTVIEDELFRIARGLNDERNTDILLALWGWRGDAPRTLESVGQEFKITRERVRQIEARALKKLAVHKFQTPIVKVAITVLQRQVPNMEETLAAVLRDNGLSRNPFSPWSIRIAAEHLKIKWPFETVRVGEERALVAAGAGESLSKAPLIVRKNSSERGCTNIIALAAELKIPEERVSGLIRFLEKSAQLQWLGDNKEWVYSLEVTRNRLFNLCSKVLGVCNRVHISELRRAVSKSRRLAMCPPQKILRSFVEVTGLGRFEDGFIYAQPHKCSPPAEDSAEGRMIRVLDTYGPVMDGEAFGEKCIEAGMNAITFYIYRMNSPIVCALGRNVYCKVGTDVPPGTVEDIVARRHSHSVASDHGWTPDGKLWFGIELTRQIITAGGIRLASFVSDLAQGEDWRVILPNGTEFGEVKCRNGFIWSFRKHFALLGAEPNDLAVFEFDLKARTILVRVGGPGLFEAIQDPESTSTDDGLEETDSGPSAFPSGEVAP